jgi:cytochrome c-type biogenesis protein CcmE
MHPIRRKRLTVVLFMVAGAAVTVALVLSALNENMNLFYTPEEVAAGAAPEGVRIRAGGMVQEGSIRRAAEGLTVEFVVSDLAGSEFTVQYTGILPALFREGQGVIATGMLDTQRRFVADEVLARHDEEYVPAELIKMHDAAQTRQADPHDS